MRPLILPVSAVFWLSACASCGQGDVRDADLDGQETDGDTLPEADFDSDADVPPEGDRDSDGLPSPEPVELVEIPHDREGMDCGPGCKQLTFGSPIYRFDVGSRYLVYDSTGEGLYPMAVLLVDLQTSKEYLLDPCVEHGCGFSTIFENTVAYPTSPKEGDRSLKTIWEYRIGDNERHAVIQRRMTNISRPVVGIDIYGDLMAWYDSAIASAGLYAMNLSGGEVIDLVTNHCVCYGDPELHGRLVVYEGWVGYSRDIWMVNVDTLVQERLVEHPGPQFDPAFDGQWVVWADGRNDPSSDAYGSRVNADIYGLDMETRTIRPICNDPSVQLFPDVRDGLVVWMDWRNAAEPNNWQDFDANTDVYLFELSTGREIRVTSDAVDAALPRVWQRRVFFVGTDLTGQTAIFVVDLDEAGLLDPA